MKSLQKLKVLVGPEEVRKLQTINGLACPTPKDHCIDSIDKYSRLSNRDDPPQTKDAAPSAQGNGAANTQETAKFRYEDYPADTDYATEYHIARYSDFDDANYSVPDASIQNYRLANGYTLRVECSPAGLIGARDFLLADGAVLRFERRIVQTIPPYDDNGTGGPNPWTVDETELNELKRLFVRLWRTMPASDRASFKAKYLTPDMGSVAT